jgi:predicted RNase H-like nuclease
VTIARFIGLDLAWREGRPGLPANETGIAVLDPHGAVVEAGWTSGPDETVEQIAAAAAYEWALLFIDAPLVVTNPGGQRPCKTHVGQRYGRWKGQRQHDQPPFAATSRRDLAARARASGLAVLQRPRRTTGGGCWLSECYPYTTLVGASELGYETERPRYKRKPRGMPVAHWRPLRQGACDDLIHRLIGLAQADPPLPASRSVSWTSLSGTCSAADEHEHVLRPAQLDPAPASRSPSTSSGSPRPARTASNAVWSGWCGLTTTRSGSPDRLRLEHGHPVRPVRPSGRVEDRSVPRC